MRRARNRCGTGLTGLTLSQQIELSIGPGKASVFPSEGARRMVWERYRAELLALEPNGRRPWAWWFYEGAAKE